MTVVSATDYYTAKALGPLGLLAAEALERRALEEELEVRRRRIEELEALRPEPGWVGDVRRRIGENNNPRVSVGGKVAEGNKPPASDRTIDFRPDARQNFEISLARGAVDRIRAEINDVAPYGLESGGYLYGRSGNRRFSSRVCHATGPGPHSQHGPDSLVLTPAHVVEENFPDWLRPEDVVRVGDYHSHPNGSPMPSQADIESWASALKRRHQSTYVGIIVTPGGDAGFERRMTGWVTHMDTYGKHFRCEPARVEY